MSGFSRCNGSRAVVGSVVAVSVSSRLSGLSVFRRLPCRPSPSFHQTPSALHLQTASKMRRAPCLFAKHLESFSFGRGGGGGRKVMVTRGVRRNGSSAVLGSSFLLSFGAARLFFAPQLLTKSGEDGNGQEADIPEPPQEEVPESTETSLPTVADESTTSTGPSGQLGVRQAATVKLCLGGLVGITAGHALRRLGPIVSAFCSMYILLTKIMIMLQWVIVDWTKIYKDTIRRKNTNAVSVTLETTAMLLGVVGGGVAGFHFTTKQS